MKHLIVVLGLISGASAFACNVEQAAQDEAKSAAEAYVGHHRGYTVEINDPQFDTPERQSSSRGVDTFSVAMQYNDSCYGSVMVKVKTRTCEIVGKTRVNEGTCTDE
jgi:hypothetical protein